MPCVSVNAGRLAASLSIVIDEYFHVPMERVAASAGDPVDSVAVARCPSLPCRRAQRVREACSDPIRLHVQASGTGTGLVGWAAESHLAVKTTEP